MALGIRDALVVDVGTVVSVTDEIECRQWGWGR